MRARRVLTVAVLALALGTGVSSVVLATHNPTVADVVAVAANPATYNMPCTAGTGQVNCDAVDIDGTWSMHATVRPANGPLISLYTIATIRYTPLNAQTTFFQSWLRDMHQPACAPDRVTAGQLATFVANVAALTSAGNIAALTIPNECNLTGGMTATQNPFGTFEYGYWINSSVIQPPTPTPTPTPSPVVTPKPTVNPTVITPTPTPSATATPSATPSASPTASPTESPTPNPIATEGPTATPGASLEGGVGAAEGTPEPTEGPGKPEGGVEWAGSVAAPDQVSTDPAALGMSALIAFLLLIIMGFVGELFNNTLESNYGRVTGWWRTSWLGRIGNGFSRFWGGGGT